MSSTVSSAWPPKGPTTTTKIIPAYLYTEYNDDQDCQAFVTTYNEIAQQYLDWFNSTPIGDYTNLSVSGLFLDWVANGLYGMKRPTLLSGSITAHGPLDTWELNTIELDQLKRTGAVTFYTVSDDIFRRILTWHFFKGDGQVFTILWLKRRIVRFLTGFNGVSTNIDNTYQISIQLGVFPAATTILVDVSGPILLLTAQIFQAAVASGVLELPFQRLWTVVLSTTANLISVSGVLTLVGVNAWPTSSAGLPAGAVYSNAGVATVVLPVSSGGGPPRAQAFLGAITPWQLLMLGGLNLPTSDPLVHNQLWVNSTSGIIRVSP